MPLTHNQLIRLMSLTGRIPVSPFMHYWTLSELLRYAVDHLEPVVQGEAPSSLTKESQSCSSQYSPACSV